VKEFPEERKLLAQLMADIGVKGLGEHEAMAGFVGAVLGDDCGIDKEQFLKHAAAERGAHGIPTHADDGMLVVHQAHDLFAFGKIKADEPCGMKADEQVMRLGLGEVVKDGIKHVIARRRKRQPRVHRLAGLEVKGLQVASLDEIDLKAVYAEAPIGVGRVGELFLQML